MSVGALATSGKQELERKVRLQSIPYQDARDSADVRGRHGKHFGQPTGCEECLARLFVDHQPVRLFLKRRYLSILPADLSVEDGSAIADLGGDYPPCLQKQGGSQGVCTRAETSTSCWWSAGWVTQADHLSSEESTKAHCGS